MKNTLKNVTVLVLALSMLIGAALPAFAAQYTWEDGKVPTGWTHTQTIDDISATNILGPINPNANQESKNLYGYLCTVSDSQSFLTGQFDIGNAESAYNKMIEEFGKEPALYSVRFFVEEVTPEFGGTPDEPIVTKGMDFYDVDSTLQLMKKHYDNGNVLLIHTDSVVRSLCAQIAMKNKPTKYESTANTIIELDKTNPDRDMQAYAAWMKYQNQVVANLKRMEEMGVKAYMWRPWVEFDLHEFSGVNEDGYSAFVRVFQQTVQTLIDAKLEGFLVCYAPAAQHTLLVNRNPGNEYVDTYAPTMYSGSENLGHLGSWYPDYEWYVKTGKPIGFSEWSCRTGAWRTVNEQGRASCFDLLKDTVSNWPRLAWVNFWGDGSYSPQDLDGKSSGNDDGMLYMDSPFTITLDEMVDYRQGVINAPGLVQLYRAKGDYSGLEAKAYTAAELSKMGIDLSKIIALRLNSGLSVTFYSKDNCTGDFWGYGQSVTHIGKDTAAQWKSCKVEYVKNLAQDVWDIWASVNDGNAYKANDGRSGTLWEGDINSLDNESDPGTAWLMIDLGKPVTIPRYVVKTAGAAERAAIDNVSDYLFQYSDDGETWKTADTVKNNTLGVVDHTISPVKAQYFRLYVTKANNTYIQAELGKVTIAEFELYGVDSGLAVIEEEPELPKEEGLYKIDGVWVYVKDGAIQKDYTGFAKHRESNTWFYVTNGQIDWNLDGAFKHPSGIWFIVKGGQIDWSFNGFYKANGVWFYFKNGQIVWETTGLYKHPSGTWFYVKNAQIDWGYTGFAKHNESNTWFYCENGSIAWTKSGAFKHPSGIWFMVNGGQIDWKFNGFYKVSGIWFYFENGQINWNLTGLYKLPSANAWFYVKNAQIDWSYNGKATKNGVTFNVRNGQVIF